jgi:hypothetical protein
LRYLRPTANALAEAGYYPEVGQCS